MIMSKNNIPIGKLKKIITAIKSSKAKFVTAERLSNEMGIIPEKILDICTHFNPLVKIDFTFDLRELLDDMEQYVNKLRSKKKSVKKKNVTKKKIQAYENVVDFIYEKMTFGGIVDKTIILTDFDLRTIRRLAKNELDQRKSGKKAK
jgi:hypothetical protein